MKWILLLDMSMLMTSCISVIVKNCKPYSGNQYECELGKK